MNRPTSRKDRHAADNVRAIVRDVVAAQPHPAKLARSLAAGLLGIAERRVQMWIYGDVKHVSEREAALIRGRHQDALRATARRLDAERAAIEAQINALQGTTRYAETRCMDALSDRKRADRRRPSMRRHGEALS